MDNKKLIRFFVPNQNIYLWIIGILALILFAYNKAVSVFTFVILIYLIYYKVTSTNKSEKQWKEIVENLSLEIDAATQNILLDLPFPLLIIKSDGQVIWYNSYFRSFLDVESDNILSMNISELVEDVNVKKIEEIINNKTAIDYRLGGKTFKVFSNKVKNVNNDDIYMVYWLDITDYDIIKQNYIREKPLMAYIQIDNYDEVIQDSEESYRPLISAVIDRKINSWAAEFGAFIKKYETDKYLMVFEQMHLRKMEDKRFNILDIIRETESGNKIPITLSIGIGTSINTSSFQESQLLSRSALDIALARGGDQAVVKKDEKIAYYGGKSQATERRTKVKARVKAHGIKELIENSDRIFIMGHQNPDIDSLGAALGIYRCSKFLGKEANIILGESNPSIDILYQAIVEYNDDIFMSSEAAMEEITSNSAVIVVDAHRSSFLEDNRILEKTDKIIIVDHHRRGIDFIEKAVLVFLEPYASSTCELVAEIIEYMDDNIKLEEIEATALLAGIYMDTKDFSFRTGVRTFEAASYLRRRGADINKCKQFLKDDKDVFLAKIQAVKEAEITDDNIAISTINYKSDKMKLIVAQSADELLNLQGVDASFVIAESNGEVIISARSLGNINVQLILEKLGGGGHLSIAGAQITNVTVDEAKELIKEEIKNYMEEGRNK